MPPEDPVRPAPPPALSWLLLAAAFSPVLIDLFVHFTQRPWAAYSVVFLPLFLLELSRAPIGRRRPRLGWSALGLALLLELVLVAGGLTRAARLALALAAFGMGWIQGRPTPRATALLVLFVPVPSAVVSWASPGLEGAWARAAAALLQRTGKTALVEVGNTLATLDVAAGRIRLIDADGGLAVAALLVGLAWYAGHRRGWSIAGTLARALPCALLAVPIQIAALFLMGAWFGGSEWVRLALDVGPWALVATLALLGPCRPSLAAPTSAAEPLSSRTP